MVGIKTLNPVIEYRAMTGGGGSNILIGQATAVIKGLRVNLIVGAEPESEE